MTDFKLVDVEGLREELLDYPFPPSDIDRLIDAHTVEEKECRWRFSGEEATGDGFMTGCGTTYDLPHFERPEEWFAFCPECGRKLEHDDVRPDSPEQEDSDV